MILRAADEAIEAGGGTFLSEQELREWREEFSYCAAKVVDSKASTSQVRMAAIGAFGAAFLIGAAAAESEGGAAILAKWKKDLLLRAQRASVAKSAPRKQETLSAVRLAMKAAPAKLTRGEAFARHIQPEVAKHLGRDVSVSTIRNAVRAILKEVPRK